MQPRFKFDCQNTNCNISENTSIIYPWRTEIQLCNFRVGYISIQDVPKLACTKLTIGSVANKNRQSGVHILACGYPLGLNGSLYWCDIRVPFSLILN